MKPAHKQLWPVLLLVGLTACSGGGTSATPETAAAAEITAVWTVGEMRPLYSSDTTCYYRSQYRGWKSEDDSYGYNLVTRVDYDTLEETPVCRVPGCTHDSSECLAYLNLLSQYQIIAAGDGSLLLYHLGWDSSSEQNMMEAYEAVLNDPARLEVEYPGERGRQYLQECIDQLQEPSYVDRISADGLSRERLVTLPEGVNPSLVCWDGEALYGMVMDGNLDVNTVEYVIRIGLDSQVDTFEIPDPGYTTMMGGWNGKLVLRHFRSPVDMNTMFLYGNYSGFYALEREATYDCWLYDPATGETEKIRMPDDKVRILSIVGDELVYSRSVDQQDELCVYDLLAGESRTLCTLEGSVATAAPINNPGGAERFVYSYKNQMAAIMELSTGYAYTLEELQQMAGEIPSGYYVSSVLCETGDDRLLLELYASGSRYPIYTTIPSPVTPEEEVADVQTSLQSVQEYVEQAEEAAS